MRIREPRRLLPPVKGEQPEQVRIKRTCTYPKDKPIDSHTVD